MNTLTEVFQTLAVIFFYAFLTMMITSCSGDDDTEKKNQYDHPHAETIDMEKHLFEHEFAEQCITKESANLENKKAGRERFAEPCMCIATYLLKDLASKDPYTFLNDKQHAQSLRIKYDEAVNHCL
ncbi:MAG: hypothetical protein L3J75_10425 [Methylococcaceae bacterium]|nr:hypothetical protein [Methylococcaceae bacterium]